MSGTIVLCCYSICLAAGGSDSEESTCNAGDHGSVPGMGRSPGEGHSYPPQYSGLENSTDRGAWQVPVLGVTQVRHSWGTFTQPENINYSRSGESDHFFLFFFNLFYFYFFIFICTGFCHTLKWNSHGFTCVPHPDPPPHLPLHPLPLGFPSAPGPSAFLMHPTWAGDLFHPR